MHRDDWLALEFFGKMYKSALADTSLNPDLSAVALAKAEPRTLNPVFVFRADISRPPWQRDWLDGLVDLMCVSRQFFLKNERCMEMKHRQGIAFWHYGTGNDIRATNLTGEAWGVKVVTDFDEAVADCDAVMLEVNRRTVEERHRIGEVLDGWAVWHALLRTDAETDGKKEQ
jgi:hypothetical protein